MSAPAEPVLIVNDHAKRHQDVKIPPLVVEALGLTPEQVRELYVSDSQDYSNGTHLIQLHFKTDTPSAEVQKYRGVVLKYGDPFQPTVVSECAKSFPYADPIITDELPPSFEQAKFSISRQGVVVRVFSQFGQLNLSTHRKIHCAKSKFGQSATFEEMFKAAAARTGFDAGKLFPNNREARLFCHVFFVSHADMRLIPTTEDEPELVYLGSLKTKSKQVMWADADDEEEEAVRLEEMAPADPKLPELEALRPVYYTYPEAKTLFEQGVPLIAWVEGQAPTRLVPTSYDRKEKIRGNTPNLKLAWYKLLDRGEQDTLREVLPASKHHLLDEYRAELMQMVDAKPTTNAKGETVMKGPPMPTKGSLIEHLLDQLAKLRTEPDRQAFIEKLGKGTGPVVKRLESYAANLLGKTEKEKTKILARFLRNHLWLDLTCERVYTLIAEFKRAIAPPTERAAAAAAAAAE